MNGTLIIQDTTAGAQVLANRSEAVQVGDRVEVVVGFRWKEGGDTARSDCLLRKMAKGIRPAGFGCCWKSLGCTIELLAGAAGGRGVGPEDSRGPTNGGLQKRSARVPSRVASGRSAANLCQWAVVCRSPGEPIAVWRSYAHGGGDRATFRWWRPWMYCCAPADLVLLERPPWWTREAHRRAGGGIALVLIGSLLLWIRALRRRDRAAHARIAGDHGPVAEEDGRVSATLAERDRLAAEIHDTLEQS